jgi:hypothetical protein
MLPDDIVVVAVDSREPEIDRPPKGGGQGGATASARAWDVHEEQVRSFLRFTENRPGRA